MSQIEAGLIERLDHTDSSSPEPPLTNIERSDSLDLIPSRQVSPILDTLPDTTCILLPVLPSPATPSTTTVPSTRPVLTPNGGEPPQTQRRVRRTKLEMQEEYNQMTTAEKAVRDRAKTRYAEWALARVTVRNTARPT